MAETLTCWNCGTALDQVPLPVSRHEYCPRCAEAVHCCRMCTSYDATAPGQCRDDRADPPTDKTCANFCDFFTPRRDGPHAAQPSRADAARAKLDALFGGSGEGDAD